MEPPWVGGTKVCSQHLGHMTKMASTPIYGKNPSKIFSRTGGPISTETANVYQYFWAALNLLEGFAIEREFGQKLMFIYVLGLP